MPLIVCGDINDGPGMDTSERKLDVSGIERLMGTIWKPELTLGNALFDSLDEDDRQKLDLSKVATTRFQDPIFERTYHKVWIDHILYTRNRPSGWINNGKVWSHMQNPQGGDEIPIWLKYKFASDHYPISVEIDTDLL